MVFRHLRLRVVLPETAMTELIIVLVVFLLLAIIAHEAQTSL